MRTLSTVLASLVVLLAAADGRAEDASPVELLRKARRVVFLGDSITASGQYVAYLEAWILTQPWESAPTLINCGLPSETVSGLSEEGHAGGRFPRPDLAERLERVLAVTKPDLVFACYGMNCGIYQPLDAERFSRYQQGLKRLTATVEGVSAKLVLITPPFYDDQRSPRTFSYNEVLGHYGAWLLKQRAEGWRVIDLHGPMTQEVATRRERDLQFTFQPDGVHPSEAGHWFIAQQVVRGLGDDSAAKSPSPAEFLTKHKIPADVLPLIEQRMGVLRDAYVSAAGHKRPGVATGLPIAAAEQKAAELSAQIAKIANQPRP